MRQLLRVFDRDGELTLAQAGLVEQLDHRAVVGMAAGDQDMANSGFVGDFAADQLHHGFGWPTADIDSHQCDFFVARGDHDRLGHQRIERTLGGHGVPRTITPHRDARRRCDVLIGGADQKVGARRRGVLGVRLKQVPRGHRPRSSDA